MTKPLRILLKLSGEALCGDGRFGIDSDILEHIATEVLAVRAKGHQIGIVVGGGNLFRGSELESMGIDRCTGDQMGMLATTMNGLVMRDTFEQRGLKSRLMSGLAIAGVADTFDHRDAKRYLSEGDIMIFVGGTGNPYFTTDTAACLRGIEIHADILFKATKVSFVYDKDPSKFQDAKPHIELSYAEVLEKGLAVMDMTAIALAMAHKKPIRIFSMMEKQGLQRAIDGAIGTLIH